MASAAFPLQSKADPNPARSAGARTAILATANPALSAALLAEFRELRWSVRATSSAAAIFDLLEASAASVCLVDSWMPDLDAHECVAELHALYPEMALLPLDGSRLAVPQTPCPLRTEALHALRRAQARLDGVFPEGVPVEAGRITADPALGAGEPGRGNLLSFEAVSSSQAAGAAPVCQAVPFAPASSRPSCSLPEFLGEDPRLLEVSRRIRLVAPRQTSVLVHGETGTGKELVARALHRLGGRAGKLVSVNCAAIPETLIESELFGHARGAFTGAQIRRTGRIEAAEGGTLFLDEVGELSLAAQSKLLRFLESGTIQRVGENEEIAVDVRVVAATHRPLARMAREGQFRLDLLHRLSIFLIQTPSLAGRTEDIDILLCQALADFAFAGQNAKQFDAEARAALLAHQWPGNVRELRHTVERACILAGDQAVIDLACIDFGGGLE